MNQLAGGVRDINDISRNLHEIVQTWQQSHKVDARVESNPPPASLHPSYVWLTWAWDGYRWRVVRWDGRQWVFV
ncbi:MAG TPA: hypothetical protein VF723_04965 [Pyrinomonadaceae bacterium]|jgi:hypothetical protein